MYKRQSFSCSCCAACSISSKHYKSEPLSVTWGQEAWARRNDERPKERSSRKQRNVDRTARVARVLDHGPKSRHPLSSSAKQPKETFQAKDVDYLFLPTRASRPFSSTPLDDGPRAPTARCEQFLPSSSVTPTAAALTAAPADAAACLLYTSPSPRD